MKTFHSFILTVGTRMYRYLNQDIEMKTQYRIIEKHYVSSDGLRVSRTFFIPQYRNLWTLFIWQRLHPFFAIYSTFEGAEYAIAKHKGFKTVKKEVARF